MTTNFDRIVSWHRDKPVWAQNLTARDWSIAELIAEQLDIALAPEPANCQVPYVAHYCTRQHGHEGACVLAPLT